MVDLDGRHELLVSSEPKRANSWVLTREPGGMSTGRLSRAVNLGLDPGRLGEMEQGDCEVSIGARAARYPGGAQFEECGDHSKISFFSKASAPVASVPA